MRLKQTQAVSAFLALLCCTAALAETITGKVVGVTDGDTIKVLTDEFALNKVRLASIDAPEKGQPYGNRSKQALSDLIYGNVVAVHFEDRDRYGRIIGNVRLDRQDINSTMVAIGAAWVYRKYSNSPTLLQIEEKARNEGFGLWGLDDPVPPWEWRRK